MKTVIEFHNCASLFPPRLVPSRTGQSPLPRALSPPFVQRASWIWSAEATHAAAAPAAATPSHYQLRMFRRTFDVREADAARLEVHVSGDSRYLFFCNGALVGRGPAKGDVNHHF